jgi:lipoprotein NlpD
MIARAACFALAATGLALGGCIPDNRPPHVAAAPAPAAALVPLPAPPAPPAWVASPVVADAVTVTAQVYTVAKGDSLRAISNRTGAASEAIARENALAAPFTIRTGQKLRIPGGRYHRVRRAQSGIAIARAYGVEWQRVVTLNQLEPPYILREGQRLLLPSQAEVATMTVEQRAAAFRLDIEDIVTGSEPALAENAKPAPPVARATRTLPPGVAVAPPATAFDGRFVWPLDGRVIRPYGSFGSGGRNNGINIAAARGTPIRAAADGVVAYVGTDVAIYGGLVLIRHGNNWITAYGHAETIAVTRGQAVKRGQPIGVAGMQGAADEPQLHFEIRQGRTPVNPVERLPRRG